MGSLGRQGARLGERISPVRCIVRSWSAFALAAILTTPLTLRYPAVCAVSVALGSLVFVLTARSSGGSVSSRCHTELERPSPHQVALLLPIVATLAGLSLPGYGLLRLDLYSYLPYPQLLVATLVGVGPLVWLTAARWNNASATERRLWWVASIVVLGGQAVWISAIGLQLVFLGHYSAFDAARADAAGSGLTRRDVALGCFHFDELGETVAFQSGLVYFAAGQCGRQYRGSFEGDRAAGAPTCFSRAAGMGFYFLPSDMPKPPLNENIGGRLFGGWRWYVDD